MSPISLEELEAELQRDPRSRRFYELAREYQKRGRVEEAAALCEKGLAAYPNHWQARLLLGQICVAKGSFEKARDMVEKVLLAMPDSVPANHLAADIYWADGNRDRALKHYQIVDLLEPGRADVRERLSELSPPAGGGSPVAGDVHAEETPEPGGEAPPAAAPAGPDSGPSGAASFSFDALVSAPVAQDEESPSTPSRGADRPPAAQDLHEPVATVLQETPWGDDGDGIQAFADDDTANFETLIGAGEPQPDTPPSGREEEAEATGEVPATEAASEPAPFPEDVEPSSLLPPAAFPATPRAEEPPSGLNTFTLAELYERQGYPEKAVEIYQRMLLQDPDNPVIHGRIKALMQRMVGEAPEAPVVHQEDVERALRQKRIQTLQGWLRRVREDRHV